MTRKPEVGDRLYLVHSDKRERRFDTEVVVAKVGRRWAKIEIDGRPAGRFEIGTGQVDNGGYGSSNSIYESESAWEEAKEVDRVLGLIRYSRGRTPAVSLSDALKAAKLLGIEA